MSCIILLSACLLMGCSSGIELTDEENNMVAEYMAGTLLKYDHYYEEKLIINEEEETDDTKNVTVNTATDVSSNEEDKKVQNTSNNETKNAEKKEKSESNVSLADVFAGKDYTITYKNNTLSTFYPENNSVYVIEASKGKKLAVISMAVKNVSKKTKTVDLSKEGIAYSLEAGGKTYNEPMITVIPSNVQFFNETIQPLKTKEAILIFEVDSKTNLKGSSLSVNMNGKTAKITLK